MSKISGYLDYVLDQLSDFGDVVPRRMFGGIGLFRGGLMFALIDNDILYFKVDDSNRGDYEASDCGPFRPFKDKKTVMQYYEVPVDVIEDRDELGRWAGRAYAVALNKRKVKSSKKEGKKN